jgi:hypothetical protein
MTTRETSRSPELIEVIRAAIEQATGDVFVALPGKVAKYDSARQVAEVKPLLKRAVLAQDGSEGLDTLPPISDVPVVFPRAGGYFLSLPVSVGDNVLLVFCDRSIDEFSQSPGGSDLDPVDFRTHDISDAVAIPGFYPTPRAITDSVKTGAAFGKEHGAQVRVTDNGTVEATSNGATDSAGGFVALASLVLSELQKIQTALTTHAHAGVTTGSGTSGTAASVYVPSAVASVNLKAD